MSGVTIERVSVHMDGTPTPGTPWEPTDIVREFWGFLKIEINGVDVSTFRGVHTQILSWTYAEPFGDATFSFRFPQITPFERFAHDDLEWMEDWADVVLYRVPPSGPDEILWEGMIASINDELSESDLGVEIEAMGSMFQADLYVRAPQQIGGDGPKVGDFFAAQFDHAIRPALRTEELVIEDEPRKDPDDPDTAHLTKRTGQWNRVLTGFIQDELALLVTEEDFPRQYTLHLDRPRTPTLRLKDYTTIHHEITVGTPGIDHSLKHDQTQSANVIYGEGTDQAGTIWRNSRRSDAGLTTYQPLAANPLVHTIRDIDGEPVSPIEVDPEVIRTEIHYGYGAGVDFHRGVESAEAQLKRDEDSGWIGTITLKTDPEEASRFEILAGQNILYKGFRPTPLNADVRPDPPSGMIVDIHGRVYESVMPFTYIGTLFHIAGVSNDLNAMTTTLTVDTKARDLLSLAELIARQNEGHLDPAKRLRIGQSDIPDDTKDPWDYHAGSGYVPMLSVHGNGELDGDPTPTAEEDHYIFVPGSGGTKADRWRIVQIRAAEKASVMRTEFRIFDASGNRVLSRFHVSVYGFSKVIGDMPDDPFAEGAWNAESDNPLDGPPTGFIIGWGHAESPAGFHRGNGTDPTGVLIDDATWQFQLSKTILESGLYVAVYCEVDAYFQGRLMQGVE